MKKHEFFKNLFFRWFWVPENPKSGTYPIIIRNKLSAVCLHLQDATQETPEDGIIDDEVPAGDEESVPNDENDQEEQVPPAPEESSEDAIKDETNPEEVLASG